MLHDFLPCARFANAAVSDDPGGANVPKAIRSRRSAPDHISVLRPVQPYLSDLPQPVRGRLTLPARRRTVAAVQCSRSGRMRAIYVMVKCEMGQAYRVAQLAADTIAELSELHSTSGQYDLLGKFYLEPEQDTGLFVTEKLQTLPGVKDTYTLITFNAFVGGRG
jgi:DNA-binding Lrp family transcriptional regulator